MPKYISGGSDDSVLPAGKYAFVVEGANTQTSKGGNEMIRLMLRVSNTAIVWDYLVFSGDRMNNARIDQFRRALGEIILPDEEVEILPSDLIGKTGWVNLTVETWEGRKQNKVGSYLEIETSDEIPGLKKS